MSSTTSFFLSRTPTYLFVEHETKHGNVLQGFVRWVVHPAGHFHALLRHFFGRGAAERPADAPCFQVGRALGRVVLHVAKLHRHRAARKQCRQRENSYWGESANTCRQRQYVAPPSSRSTYPIATAASRRRNVDAISPTPIPPKARLLSTPEESANAIMGFAAHRPGAATNQEDQHCSVRWRLTSNRTRPGPISFLPV